MLEFCTMRESKVLDFHQRNGENMKKAWDRISEAHKANMPWLPIRIVLRNFYFGLFKWCKNSLDLIAEGDFLECDEARTLEIIHGLSSYFVYDSLKFNMDKLSSYHEHANGDISEIKGKIKDVPVTFLKGIAMVYFFIMKPNQGNIVLGRDFLRAVKGFIDIGK